MTPATYISDTPTTDLTRIEDLTRREFMLGALGAAVLIACGDDDETPSGGQATRTISNGYGTCEVPVAPQRLVVMDNRDALETAVALGLAPKVIGQRFAFVGSRAKYAAPWVPIEEREPELYDGREPDLELILSQDPDLILADSGKFEDGPTFEELSRIAPVVAA